MTNRSTWRWLGVALLASAMWWSGASAPGPASAADTGPVLGGALPGPLPLFPPDNWWNTDVSVAPLDLGSAAYIAFIRTAARGACIPTWEERSRPAARRCTGCRTRSWAATQPKMTVFFRAYPGESDGVGVPFYPIPTQAITQPHWIEGGDPATVACAAAGPAPAPRGPRQPCSSSSTTPLERPAPAVGGGLAAPSSPHEATRAGPTGGRAPMPPASPSCPGLVRYDEVFGSDADTARVPHHRPQHQWLRVSRLPPRGEHAGRAADGSTAAAEGEQTSRLPRQCAEDLPGHEDLRPHRGRQRLEHVHQRHLRPALEQRRAQPRVRRGSRPRTSRSCSSAGSRTPPRRRPRRRSR